MPSMPIDEHDAEALADRISQASDAQRSIAPITDARPGFDLADAYRVSARDHAAAHRARRAAGRLEDRLHQRSIWAEQALNAPIWGPMYDTTVAAAKPAGATLLARRLLEPRIEPEIGFRLARVPIRTWTRRASRLRRRGDARLRDRAVGLSRLEAQAGRRRRGLRHARRATATDRSCRRAGGAGALARDARDFTVVLFRDGVEMDRGAGRTCSAGRSSALRHFVARHAPSIPGYALRPGDLVTTGTLTRAFPVAPGERWSTKLEGIPLPAMDLDTRR